MAFIAFPQGGGKRRRSLEGAPVGSIVKIKENGVLQNYKVAQHDYIRSGVTAIERVLCLSDTVSFNSSGVNTYGSGTLDTFLTGTFRNRLDQSVRDALVTVNIPVTPGNRDYTLTTIARNVFVFSGAEIGVSFDYMIIEGSRVNIYTDDDGSRIKYSDDAPATACIRWTRSAGTNSSVVALAVFENGTTRTQNVANTSRHFAPVLTLPSSLLLSPEGELL